MNNRRPQAAVGAVAAIILVLIAGGWGVVLWSSHDQATTKNQLATGYEAHSLIPPFTLASKTWHPAGGLFSSGGTWSYQYTATVAGPAALAAAQKQLGQGGYQVVATSPDVINSSHATLYRDLITGDDSIKVDLDLDASPVTATVTVSPLSGQ